MPNQKDLHSTTQQFLDIYDITNDLVILKDGTTSLIITVDAMNFGLLAEEEQDSIMYAYAGLLNSLNYPIQIIIHSQTKDVTGYLRLLKEQEDTAINRTQQIRIAKYREFVSNLIRERNVLDKKFYITIPAKPLELGLMPASSVIPGKGQTDISTVDKALVLEKAKNILEPKRDHLIAQFARIGLYSRQLETQEIIQLFYQSYNPEAFEGQDMDDSKNYTAPLVSASIEDSPMNMADIPQPAAAQPAGQQQVLPQQAPVEPTPEPMTQPAVSSTPNAMAQPVIATPGTQQQPMTGQPVAPPQSPATTQTVYTPTQMSATPTMPVATTASQATPAETSAQPVASSAPNTMTQPTAAPVAGQQPIPQQQTPVEPTPAAQPAPQQPVAGNSSTQNTSSPTANEALPPAPKLPNIPAGQVDSSVPQETEIEIQHPTAANTNGELPPLPEIQ